MQEFLAKLPRPDRGEPLANPPPQSPPVGGTWTNVTTAPIGLSNPLLLTDGTVIAHAQKTQTWYKLTPSMTGSYSGGTWSAIASLPSGYGPLYFASAVLPDGRVIIQGGEYNITCTTGNGECWVSLGAIYDPVANTWTNVNPPSGSGWVNTDPCCGSANGGVGDAQAIVLPNGTFMLGACCANPPLEALFNATTLTYSATGAPPQYQDEQGYTLLQNGKVLTIDVWTDVPATHLYNPAAGTWAAGASTPVSLIDPCGNAEIGPAVTRPDGTTVAFGGNALCTSGAADPTAIYTAASNSWVAGPNVIAVGGVNYTLADAPAAMLPNGNILFAGSPGYGVHADALLRVRQRKYHRAGERPGAICVWFFLFLLQLPCAAERSNPDDRLQQHG